MYNTVVRRIVRSILKEMNLVCLSGYYITTTREIGINEGNVAAELFNLRNDVKLQIKLVRSLILWLSIHLMTIVIASIFVKLLLVDLSKAWLFFKCSAGIVSDIICGAILLSVYDVFYMPDFLLAMLRHIFMMSIKWISIMCLNIQADARLFYLSVCLIVVMVSIYYINLITRRAVM